MTGRTALAAVATAVYPVLIADAQVAALVANRITDHALQDPAFPLVLLGGWDEQPQDTMGLQGRTVKFEAHIWSSYVGMVETFRVLDALVAALRGRALDLDGWECEAVLYDGASQLESELVKDLEIQHMVARFSVLVTEA